MPRQARLDAPGTLHRVIIRGIERKKIVSYDQDRQDFVARMCTIALETETFTTHDSSQVASLADHTLILNHGRLVG